MKQKLTQKTKKVVVADRFTTNVEIEFGGDLFPRPLLASGSPFRPPLNKEYFPTGNSSSQTLVGSPQTFLICYYFLPLKGKIP